MMNCSCEEIIDETDTEYVITQVFGWLTGILALVKVFFFTVTLLIKKYAKNISPIFVVIGIIGAICAIIFGVRINEISIYVRGVVMLVLSIIICIAKIVFDIEYDKKHKLKEIELSSESNKSDSKIIDKLKLLKDKNELNERIKYNKGGINIYISKNKIKINSIELDFQNSIIQNIIDFISKVDAEV
jgi:uncharacterized protein with PQ loop repeat